MTLLFFISAFAQEGGATIGANEEARLHFRLGTEAYEARAYDEALEHMLHANRLTPDPTIVYNIAAIYEVTRRHEDAYNAYGAYQGMEGVTPDRIVLAEDAQQRLESKVALLEVTSDVPGASVYITRRERGVRGTTPLTLAVPAGERRVLVERVGYRPAEATAEAKVGARAKLPLVLDPILVDVLVSGTPADAVIRNLDEPDAPPQALGKGFQLPVGRYTLEVSKPGFTSFQLPLDLEDDGRVARVQVRLDERMDEDRIRKLFSESAKTPDSTRIYGYIDSYWEQVAKTPASVEIGPDGNQTVVREDNPNEFDVLNLNLMVQGTLAGKYRYFLNLAAPGSGGVSDNDFGIRNAWVDAPIYRDLLRVRFGKLYRRFGLYNEILDATPTFIGIEPPELFDGDHLFLTRTTNLMVHGDIEFGLSNLQYSLTTGNDERTGFSVPLGWDLRVNYAGEVTVGTSGYWSGKSAPTNGVGEGPPKGGVLNWMEEDRFVIAGVFAEYAGTNLTLQGEYFLARHEATRDPDAVRRLDTDGAFITPAQRSRFIDENDAVLTDATYVAQTAYLRAGYSVPVGSKAEVVPYVQGDWYRNPETLAPKSVGGDNEAGFSDDGQFFKVTAGGVVRPIQEVALKVDGSAHIQQLAGQTEFYPEVRVSLSYLWELNLK